MDEIPLSVYKMLGTAAQVQKASGELLQPMAPKAG